MSLPKTARAAVVAAYGEPIEVRELPVPGEDELELAAGTPSSASSAGR